MSKESNAASIASTNKASAQQGAAQEQTRSPQEMSTLRDTLNVLDQKLIVLLAERRALSERVAEVKENTSLPIRDQAREEEMLIDRIKQGRDQGLDAHYITRVFHEVIDDSLRTQQDYLQRRLNSSHTQTAARTVAFHGIEGSYSHIAAKKYFSRQSDKTAFVGKLTFPEVIKSVENGQADFALLPLENTNSGANSEVYELLLHSQISIVGEEKCKIEHCLIGLEQSSLSQIKRIFSSPQSVAECRNFLSRQSGTRIEYLNDSALSVKKVKDDADLSQAAIASEEAARAFGLAVLQRDISNSKENYTRYLIIARTSQKVDLRVPCKSSLVMATAHRPGSLVEALTIFKDNDINLTKLESRPVIDNPKEEMFYLDFEGNLEDLRVKTALDALYGCTRFIKVLGCYPSADLPPTSISPQAVARDIQATTGTNENAAKTAPVASESEKQKAEKKGYKLASRAHHPQDTIIEVRGVKIGGPQFVVMAGPCSIESYDQIMLCAREAKEHGALVLRGGCFKPRSSPYSFQGLGFEGLDFMAEAGKKYEMPIITEVMSLDEIDGVAAKADIIQIGARNMQNFSLLKAIGKTHRPIMLKRGLSAPIDELLQAAEYILAQGNHQVMLCERGIRTFETATRSTLDISAVPVLKRKTHLPIIIDPSHAAGDRELVIPLALAAKAVGAHGIIVEFHPEPEKALSDGPQALRFPQFESMMQQLLR